MVAGTSTGGILACLYLKPDPGNSSLPQYAAEDGLKLYMRNGDSIFDVGVWRRVLGANGLLDEKYSAENLERLAKKVFGNVTLGQLLKPCLVTAYATQLHRPFFFKSHNVKTKTSDDYYVREVVRATSAAPTYFEAAMPDSLDNIPNATPMIDGGVFANNPAACALVEALTLKSPEFAPLNIGNAPALLGEVAVLSLGTGGRTQSISHSECKDWGLVGGARPIIDILMDGVAQAVDYQLTTLFDSCGKAGQYLRVNGDFDDFANSLRIDGLDPAMDNASDKNLKLLERFGKQLAKNHSGQIANFVNNYL